jgi:hypothetical protein
MENAQAHRFRGAPGHCLMGLATSGQWGCFTLFYSLRKPTDRAICQPVSLEIYWGYPVWGQQDGIT